MKLTITHLKAPWPQGAMVGSVIELASVPAWAVGKCVPAADDAAVTVGGTLINEGTMPAAAATESKFATWSESDISTDGLRARAAALGLKVDGRWSRERLADEIAKAQG